MIVDAVAGRVVARAPAKLNLFLEVLGKRPDGYHAIESLMVPIDLCDSLTFEIDPSGRVSLTCDDASLPTDETNLVMKAARGLREFAGVRQGARIGLSKQIPTRAGLGGGSSDAATTLAALCHLWNLDLEPRDLTTLAGALGSDVPFFLAGGAAVCRGRGESVEPVRGSMPLYFVLICPDFGVGTSDVYARVEVSHEAKSVSECLEAFRASDTGKLGRALFNRLQSAAQAIAPDLVQVRDALATLGSSLDGHLMSGSG